jgi:hypothetical protein
MRMHARPLLHHRNHQRPATMPSRLHTHFDRLDPTIQLAGVPDVMRWGADGPTAKMGTELEKAGSPAEAVAAVAAFVNRTA